MLDLLDTQKSKQPVTPLRDNISTFFVVMPTIFVTLVLIGLWHNYSPVPYWDMWDGYILFYTKVANGDWHQWFAQHNEHRIILSRLLFWLDIRLFGGKQIFLVVLNLLFFLSFVGLMIRIGLDLKLHKRLPRNISIAIFGFITILGLSWIQNINFVWAFQSQFITAYLLPLTSFYALQKAANTSHSGWLLVSIVTGIASAGTMANGIATLFILFAMSLYIRTSINVSVAILLLAVVTAALYLHNYHNHGSHGNLLDTITNEPQSFFLYLLTYLGNPFYYIFFRLDHIEILFGLLFLAITCTLLLKFLRAAPTSQERNLLAALFAFIAYVSCTAILTAGGRSIFGLDQANTSRYTTPTIYAWIALLIIATHLYQHKLKDKKTFPAILVVITILLIPDQLKTLKNAENKLNDQMIAALALEMGANDPMYVTKIYPNTSYLLPKLDFAREEDISIFGHPSLEDANTFILTKSQTALTGPMALQDAEFQTLENNQLRVTGWLCDIKANADQLLPFAILKNNLVVGHALTQNTPEGQEGLCTGAPSSEPISIIGYMTGTAEEFLPGATHRQLIHLQRWLPDTHRD